MNQEQEDYTVHKSQTRENGEISVIISQIDDFTKKCGSEPPKKDIEQLSQQTPNKSDHLQLEGCEFLISPQKSSSMASS